MVEVLLNLAVLAGILGLSFLLTQWYARKMYNHCPRCATLNARRRTHCRSCGEALSRG